MKRRSLPTINALTAFEAAARLESVAQAAEELNLSQSAVSRLVQQVEYALEVPLFLRVKQRIVVTDAGRAYAANIRKMLYDLEQTTLRVMSYGSASGNLSLGVFSTFASKWLLPRLPDFRRNRPDVVISCFVRREPFNFDDDPLDAAIHYGEPVWSGAIAEPLFSETVLPVASPTILDIKSVREPSDVTKFPLLHEITRPMAWREWFSAYGVDAPGNLQGGRFDQFGLISAAAVAGLGIALIPSFLIEEELRRGDLVVLMDRPLPDPKNYYLVYPLRNKGVKLIEEFRNWVQEQSAH
ncbi:LysR family transcriptional regulator [Pelagibacterium sp.]|uniref:LysR family transcriptional regulator n=1 Tax=Pelagibacterium sp. TaxID=1967288 RepID=UPI003C7A45E2